MLYTGISSDTEFVAVRRTAVSNRFAMSDPVSWTAGGPGRLTVLLSLWYVGMLAAALEEKKHDLCAEGEKFQLIHARCLENTSSYMTRGSINW